MPSHRTALAALFLLALTVTASAQCPDGSPPPCKGAGGGSSLITARRINPPLDRRAWIVVPFGNVMKAPELEWLRDASVNLLSLDMGRWNDVRVVPDKRVGDLVRELPASRSDAPLTLGDGLAIARRAGAGMLVMGDFFRLGKGARVVANVFDVRTGAKLRSAVQQAAEQDSLLTAFAPLARTVLAVPPPADAKVGDLGTASLEAYQAYLLGVKAMHRFDLLEARKQLTRALTLDSTFALAHLELSDVLEYGEANPNGPEMRAHALAASRLGTRLPFRERTLIEARVAGAMGERSRACDILRPLVARDSTDIQALFALGECAYHDDVVQAAANDTVGNFLGSWNLALRSFSRVLELDPGYYVVFEHILDMLGATQRPACARASPSAPCGRWLAVVLRGGDSLETVATPMSSDAFYRQVESSAAHKPRVASLERARLLAQRWVDADTASERARYGLGRVLLNLGDIKGADAQFQHLPTRATPDNAIPLRIRVDVAIKQGRAVEARALFDSLVKAIPDVPGIMFQRGSMEIAFGRMSRLNRGLAARGEQFGPAAGAYLRLLPQALLGMPSDDLGPAELAWSAAMRDPCDRGCRLVRLTASLAYSLRARRSAWPSGLDSGLRDGRLQPAQALATRDTAQLRAAIASLESGARRNIGMAWPEFAYSVIAADGYLLLHDSASAQRMVRFYVDSAMPVTPLALGFVAADSAASTTLAPGAIFSRMMLLRADLAAARGSKDEARTWYLRMLDLWADADAALQPTVSRIRAALAALGPASGQ